MGTLSDLVQFIFAGLTGGAIYALVALGFGVVHNTMGIVNFTQVDFVSLGGMLLYSALFAMGLPMPLALALAVAGVTATPWWVEVLGIRPARTDNHLVLIFLTIGLSIFLRGAMKLIWGKTAWRCRPWPARRRCGCWGPPFFPRLCGSWPSPAWPSCSWCCFSGRLPWGWPCGRWRPTPKQAARVVGLNVGRVKALSFALAGALGGLAGCLVTPITTLSYDVGVLLGLKGFAAAILGGFGSFPGAIVGGITLGLLESLTAGYLSSAYKDVVAFVVLLLVLFIRPRGLWGERPNRHFKGDNPSLLTTSRGPRCREGQVKQASHRSACLT